MTAKKKTSADNGGPQEKTGDNKFLDMQIISQVTLRCKVATWLDGQFDRTIKGPGCYIISDNETVIYIGVVHSTNRTFLQRLTEHLHRTKKIFWETPLGWEIYANLPESRDWDITLLCLLESDAALELEKKLITELRPKVNFRNTGKKNSERNQWGGWDKVNREVTS